ncbi:MAG: ribosome silencing factor [Clostridiales bacterium]|nr:ribosome silencing factor [Clostridiales bacterium]
MESLFLTKEIVKVLDEKKAIDIKTIKTEEVTVLSDYFVIASGTSSTHTKSLAEDVDYEIKKRLGIEPEHIEGRATGWTLIDYGTVLVHIFDAQSRDYYGIERLWADADILDISNILTED